MVRDKHLGIKVDEELHYKLGYIAEYEGRSNAGQIIHYIREGIRAFEKEHGGIERQKNDEQ
ncbi:MAG: hypothetical protein RR639_06430 [Hydrogenoanaerobacterium sp.]